MRVASLSSVVVCILEVDPTRSRDLVVNGSREPILFRLPRAPLENRRSIHRRGLTGVGTHVIVELLRAFESNARGELIPAIEESLVD